MKLLHLTLFTSICRALKCTVNPIKPLVISPAQESRMNHLVVTKPSLLSSAILENSLLSVNQFSYLLSLGAVYVRPFGSEAKPARVISDIEVDDGDYVRYHTDPRRFPTDHIDWRKRILYDNDDYVVIEKPAGIPCNPTVDNLHENVAESLKKYLKCDTYLAHRLDTDTSGILLIGKRKESISKLCNLFRERRIEKTYKLIIMTNTITYPINSISLQHNQILHHYTKPSMTSPRYFSLSPFPDSVDCLSRIVSVSAVKAKTKGEWLRWLHDDISHKSVSLDSANDDVDYKRFTDAFINWLGVDSSTLLTSPSAASSSPPSSSSGGSDNTNSGGYSKVGDGEELLSFCEVELELQTGRTHQCRGQMQCLGKLNTCTYFNLNY